MASSSTGCPRPIHHIEFYKQAFGAEVRGIHYTPDGKIMNVNLEWRWRLAGASMPDEGGGLLLVWCPS